MNRYSIVTGYWADEDEPHKAEFFDLWWDNTMRGCSPVNVFVINAGSKCLPREKRGNWVDLSFNLGHTHDLSVNDYPDKKFCGWSMAFIIGATICHANDSDMIVKEQDCLAFGNWLARLYSDLDTSGADMLMGPGDKPYMGQSCGQSLMILRRRFLLPFVTGHLLLPYPDSGPVCVESEMKFTLLKSIFGTRMSELTFGHNTKRPIGWIDDDTFYIQHITKTEMDLLRKAGRI